MKIIKRLTRAFRREPDFIIGGEADPYLLRWWVIPRNRFFNIYLHKFMRSDDDRALHDHPWANLSVVLRGAYVEVLPANANGWPFDTRLRSVLRTRGAIVWRRAEDAHRVLLIAGHDGKPMPCWSLFFTGRVVRQWGFWCPQGWRYYRDFVANRGNVSGIGRGCE